MVECPTCKGTAEVVVGWVEATWDEPGYAVLMPCPDCQNTGGVPMYFARELAGDFVPPYTDAEVEQALALAIS